MKRVPSTRDELHMILLKTNNFNHMKYKVMIAAVFLITGLTLSAQEPQVSLSLQQAQDYAVQHNKTLQNAKNDVLIAEEQFKNARGAGLPQANAQMDYMTNFNYAFSFGMPGGDATPPNIDYSKLDEGDYELLKFLNESMGGGETSKIVMQDQLNANIQISQLIFSGQYWIGLETAKIGRQMAEKNIQLTELDVRENVINSYYMILVAGNLLKIIQENESNLKEVQQHTENMYKVGLSEKTDVDQIGINLSQIINSKKSMERNLQLNYTMLKFWLGIAPGSEVKLTETLDELLNQVERKSLMATQMDLTNNPTYQIMLSQEDMGEKNIDMTKWAFAPTVSGFYSYTEKILKTAFDLSPKNMAGINMSIPIYGGGSKKAQVSMAKIELDKIQRSKILLEEQLVLQERQLTFEKNNAFENYMTQKENVKVAARVYQSINNKYKQGQLSSLDLTQANSNYLQAENNYTTSILQLLQSELQLDKLYNNF